MFVLLTVYNEEWDILMFREYLGVKPRMLIMQLMVLTIGHLILSKYLAAALTSEISAEFINEEEDEDAENLSDNQNINGVLPFKVDDR